LLRSHLHITRCRSTSPSRTPARRHNHLKRCLQKRRIHVAVPDVADDHQLDRHNDHRNQHSDMKIADQKGKRMPNSARRGHQPGHPTAQPRRPAPVSDPSSESPSEKAIEIPAPIEAASPTRNASQLLCEANGRCEQWRQRRYRAIHQTGQTRLHHLPAGTVLRCDSSSVAFALAVRCFSSSSPAVRSVFLSSSPSLFSNSRVDTSSRPACRSRVEPARPISINSACFLATFTPSGRTSHTGFLCKNPFTFSRRISGMRSPNRCRNISNKRSRCPTSSYTHLFKHFCRAGYSSAARPQTPRKSSRLPLSAPMAIARISFSVKSLNFFSIPLRPRTSVRKKNRTNRAGKSSSAPDSNYASLI